MGYTTDFIGKFKLNKKLDDETYNLLLGLSSTRRMSRNVDEKFGVEGEFYYNLDGNFGQTREDNIINYNIPPRTQPSLWLQWKPTEDRLYIEWDGNEKFYEYVEWLKYIISKILIPKGYSLTGVVNWYGEEQGDVGAIIIEKNEIIIDECNIGVATLYTESKNGI